MKSGGITSTRILVVEDHEPFRKFIRTFLGQLEDFQLVGEAGDGVSAVRKCVELQPDLVLLDIGLPELNGLQVARQIRQLAPGSRIVFLTQESSSAIVHEALSLGAAAYVIKAHTASDLILAIIAAREGRQFVSSGLDGSIRLNDPPSNVRGGNHTLFCAPANTAPHHKVDFYSDDLSFVKGIALCVQKSLEAGNAVLAIARELQSKRIIEALQASGLDAQSAIGAGRLVMQDTFELLAQFVSDGCVDRKRLLDASARVVEKLMRDNPGARITACGACAPALLDRGNLEGALEVERVWDEISLRYDMELLCGYIFTGFQRAEDLPGYREISAWHSHAKSH